MKTVEVFKTNITESFTAATVVERLLELMPQCRINFDLYDCDNILRVESFEYINTQGIQMHLNTIGFSAELLE